MDKNSVNWHGVIPALVTPFDKEGAVDEDAFRRNIAGMIEHGIHGVLVNGCTGEFWSLSPDDRVRLIKAAVAESRGRITVLAGTGAITPGETIELTRAAEKAGADGAVMLPPYFVKPNADDIVAHYQLVSDKTGLPICLYNIPANAVNAVGPELAKRLADIDHVVAIKESQGDWVNHHRTILAVRDRLRVFCGPSSVYGVAATQLGAVGHIDCFPNIYCKPMVDMWHAAEAGDSKRAAAIQEKTFKLTQLCTSWDMNLYVSTKAAMNILGLPGGYPRLPLRPLAADLTARLKDELAKLGLVAGATSRAAE